MPRSAISEVVWAPAGSSRSADFAAPHRVAGRGYGDFYSHILVAEGAVDIACEPELNLYDVAGVSVIVTEAGGRFSGVDGVDGQDRGSGVSSNGLLHDEVVAALSCPAPAPRSARCVRGDGPTTARSSARAGRRTGRTSRSRRRRCSAGCPWAPSPDRVDGIHAHTPHAVPRISR